MYMAKNSDLVNPYSKSISRLLVKKQKINLSRKNSEFLMSSIIFKIAISFPHKIICKPLWL